MTHGFTRDTFQVPFDDESLPGNFYVWASTKKAAFLQGRFVLAAWDVEELMEMKSKIEADTGFLRMACKVPCLKISLWFWPVWVGLCRSQSCTVYPKIGVEIGKFITKRYPHAIGQTSI